MSNKIHTTFLWLVKIAQNIEYLFELNNIIDQL